MRLKFTVNENMCVQRESLSSSLPLWHLGSITCGRAVEVEETAVHSGFLLLFPPQQPSLIPRFISPATQPHSQVYLPSNPASFPGLSPQQPSLIPRFISPATQSHSQVYLPSNPASFPGLSPQQPSLIPRFISPASLIPRFISPATQPHSQVYLPS